MNLKFRTKALEDIDNKENILNSLSSKIQQDIGSNLQKDIIIYMYIHWLKENEYILKPEQYDALKKIERIFTNEELHSIFISKYYDYFTRTYNEALEYLDRYDPQIIEQKLTYQVKKLIDLNSNKAIKVKDKSEIKKYVQDMIIDYFQQKQTGGVARSNTKNLRKLRPLPYRKKLSSYTELKATDTTDTTDSTVTIDSVVTTDSNDTTLTVQKGEVDDKQYFNEKSSPFSMHAKQIYNTEIKRKYEDNEDSFDNLFKQIYKEVQSKSSDDKKNSISFVPKPVAIAINKFGSKLIKNLSKPSQKDMELKKTLSNIGSILKISTKKEKKEDSALKPSSIFKTQEQVKRIGRAHV